MTPERWQRIKAIVADALAQPAADRDAFVAGRCGSDSDLLEEVRSLLAMEDPAGAFLEIDRPPDRVGPYRIVREIGRGGMGAVYLGERADGQFDQQVAIKVVKRGMDSSAVVRRFAAERQILARLQHPNIARLFDGGVMNDGRPYFVMEYLDAVPIAEYCRSNGLGVPARIELMRTVCDAVEYAHRHLVLHRDLKTDNILVDATGTPKLLDFGIAKVLSADDGSAVTEIGQRALTPQASSPEQIRGETLTTASDIYALGLMLYELLAGQPAYDVPPGSAVEQARVVTESQPRKPSDVAPAGDRRAIRGDLDTIVLKALEKEPGRRYASAADLSQDLRRVDEGLPIHARPAGLGYRAGKSAHRHWRALGVAAVVTGAMSWAIGDALVQGRRAERHFRDLRTLANSFVFEFHDAIARLPGSTPARELVVSRALTYLDGLAREASGDIGLKKELAQAYLRVGDVQGLYYESNLGKTADARASFEKSLTLFSDVTRAWPQDVEAATGRDTAKLHLASTYQATDPARARTMLDEILRDLSETPLEARPPRRRFTEAMTYVGIAENRQTIPAEAARARNQAIDLFAPLSREHPELADAQRFLSMTLKRRAAGGIARPDQLARAVEDLNRASEIDEKRVAANPADAVARLDLALGQGYRSAALRRSGDLAGAAAALTSAMDARQSILDADPLNLRVRTQLIGDCAKMAALAIERRLPDVARVSLERGEKLAAAVTGPAGHNPDLVAAIEELRKVRQGPRKVS